MIEFKLYNVSKNGFYGHSLNSEFRSQPSVTILQDAKKILSSRALANSVGAVKYARTVVRRA